MAKAKTDNIPDHCPRKFIHGAFLIGGMIAVLSVYLVWTNIFGTADYTVTTDADTGNIILTEHINEEDDYDKPVCKRLEESGERYDELDYDYSGEI